MTAAQNTLIALLIVLMVASVVVAGWALTTGWVWITSFATFTAFVFDILLGAGGAA